MTRRRATRLLQPLAWLLAAALAQGCGSVPTRAPQIERTDGKPPAVPSARAGGGYYLDDGPGENAPDISAIPDAVPRLEPLHKYANRPYTALGKVYTPDTQLLPYKARGVASWYGRRYHGKRTSSGEPYDMYAMTAAHPTLPIPSYVRVTNVGNGKSVVLRVNDRGPFLSDRLIDLSYAAAYKLGVLAGGSAPVEVERLDPSGYRAPATQVRRESPPVREVPVTPQALENGHFVQLGAFGQAENAEAFRGRISGVLGSLGETLQVTARAGMHRVQLGPYGSRAEADSIAQQVFRLLEVAPVVVSR